MIAPSSNTRSGTTSEPLSAVDALGRPLRLVRPPERIVSLVPSLTEALFAMGLRDEIRGITSYCVEPAALVRDVPKVGGTKTPDLPAIAALQPDLVLASAEENVREHVASLIEQRLTVYVSRPETVVAALAELADLARLTGRTDGAASWIDDGRAALDEIERASGAHPPVRYFCPIWRRPYMVAAPNTYMSDLLRCCGGRNVFDGGPARYYPVELDEAMARRPEVVLLPSEPYPFAERHRREVMAHAEVPAVQADRVYCVDGQLLTWYGPRIARALRYFAALLRGEHDRG